MVIGPTWTSPDPLILETAHHFKADLIVVGTHQRHGVNRLFHSSVSRALLHHAETNMACIPLTAELEPRSAPIPEINRVLVCTDFSSPGNAAIPFAFSTCSAGGLVKIIHVFSHSPRLGGPGSLSDLEQKLRALEPMDAGGRFAPCEFEIIVHRNPAAAICEEADRFGADLVCMSSHGGGFSNAVHGSVANDVMKHLHRPVMFVPKPRP